MPATHPQRRPARPSASQAKPGLAPFVRNGSQTLAEQLAARFAERIRQRMLAPGSRLPSVRECAAHHQVSPSTVVAAYDLLQAQGLVSPKPQRGVFVREGGSSAFGRSGLLSHSAGHKGPQAKALGAAAVGGPGAGADTSPSGELTSKVHDSPALPPPVDATALIRGMFRRRVGSLAMSPGLGTLPESWLDAPLLQRAVRRALAAPASQSWLSYGEPAGDGSLREALAQHLANLGVAAAPQQIVTSSGATHALDLIARSLLKPGDAVLVDEPGWAIEFARLSQMGMVLLPVPRGEDGPDLAVLQALAQAHKPKLYVTVSVLHNPTGACLTPSAAHQVLRLAEAHDFIVVEDDTYSWLAAPHAVRIAQLDGLKRTVYVSGFSKVLVPQWRVGYLAAAPALAERFVDAKLLSALTTPALLEQAVAHCLTQGSLRRQADRVRARLDAARTRTVRLAREAGCQFICTPQGLFGWIDVGCDTESLALKLIDEGWFTAPGALFHAHRKPSRLMRVNFATAQEPLFWQRLRALREAGGA